MKVCTHCLMWKDNINKVVLPTILMAKINPSMYTGYIGMLFKFCPWCGNKLLDDGVGMEYPKMIVKKVHKL